jgi:hypothetical protein
MFHSMSVEESGLKRITWTGRFPKSWIMRLLLIPCHSIRVHSTPRLWCDQTRSGWGTKCQQFHLVRTDPFCLMFTSIVALIVSLIIAIAVITPVSILCLYPAYHPINYTATECVVTTSEQDTFRCCQYSSCSCWACAGISCDQLQAQPLNATSCCHATSCCALWVWQTCYSQTCRVKPNGEDDCETTSYPCNPYCSIWYASEICSGSCGSCTNSYVVFRAPEFNKSQEIDAKCGLNDFSCASQQKRYTVNSTWPCYYGAGNLYLQHPKPDPLVPMYWFFVALSGVFVLCSCVWVFVSCLQNGEFSNRISDVSFWNISWPKCLMFIAFGHKSFVFRLNSTFVIQGVHGVFRVTFGHETHRSFHEEAWGLKHIQVFMSSLRKFRLEAHPSFHVIIQEVWAWNSSKFLWGSLRLKHCWVFSTRTWNSLHNFLPKLHHENLDELHAQTSSTMTWKLGCASCRNFINDDMKT